MTSDHIAALALIVSIISFWLSYRAYMLGRRLSAAEKRTEAHTLLVGALLEAQELMRCLRAGLAQDSVEPKFRKELATIEEMMTKTVSSLEARISWLRSKSSEDPLQLEEYKSYVLEVAARIQQVSPLVKKLEVPIQSFWEGSNLPVAHTVSGEPETAAHVKR